jgi:hypothetical protein
MENDRPLEKSEELKAFFEQVGSNLLTAFCEMADAEEARICALEESHTQPAVRIGALENRVAALETRRA